MERTITRSEIMTVMNTWLLLLLLVVVVTCHAAKQQQNNDLFIGSGSDSGSGGAAFVEIVTYGSGQQIVPPVNGTASAKLSLHFPQDLSKVNYTLWVHGGKKILAAHLRCGPAGATGVIIATLFTGLAWSNNKGTAILSEGSLLSYDLQGSCNGVKMTTIASLYDAMRNGQVYFNIRSKKRRGGEIRGQIYTNQPSCRTEEKGKNPACAKALCVDPCFGKCADNEIGMTEDTILSNGCPGCARFVKCEATTPLCPDCPNPCPPGKCQEFEKCQAAFNNTTTTPPGCPPCMYFEGCASVCPAIACQDDDPCVDQQCQNDERCLTVEVDFGPGCGPPCTLFRECRKICPTSCDTVKDPCPPGTCNSNEKCITEEDKDVPAGCAVCSYFRECQPL